MTEKSSMLAQQIARTEMEILHGNERMHRRWRELRASARAGFKRTALRVGLAALVGFGVSLLLFRRRTTLARSARRAWQPAARTLGAIGAGSAVGVGLRWLRRGVMLAGGPRSVVSLMLSVVLPWLMKRRAQAAEQAARRAEQHARPARDAAPGPSTADAGAWAPGGPGTLH